MLKKQFLFLLFQITSSILIAQTTVLDQVVSVNVKNKSIADILILLHEKYDLNFTYSSNQIEVEKKVSVNEVNITVQKLLEILFQDQNVEFKIIENQIIIKKSEVDKKAKRKSKYTISGIITDKSSGEFMIGATVFEKTSLLGTLANEYGFFSLTLEEGEHEIMVSYLGYASEVRKVILTRNIGLNVGLKEVSTELEEVIIEHKEEFDNISRAQTGQMNLPSASVKKMPSLLGETDLIKSLQTIPGIRGYADGSVSFHVRGGERDQNMMLIDDAPVFNPSHLFGMFSSFVSEAISDVKVYKGDIPASYGGRLSSLIDIRTRDGNKNRFEFKGNVGLISTKLSAEGPIVKEKSSFVLCTRGSHIGWIIKTADPKNELYFFDINSKFNFKLNDKNRLYFSFYYGKDFLKESTTSSGISWDNFAGTIRWNRLKSSKLFHNTTLFASAYNYYLHLSFENNQYWRSRITDLGLKRDYTWYINPNNTFKFGFGLTAYDFDPGNVYEDDSLTLNYTNIVPGRKSSELFSYIDYTVNFFQNFNLRVGLRLANWYNYGADYVFTYDSVYNLSDTVFIADAGLSDYYIGLEPRITLTYNLFRNHFIKISYNRNKQYLQAINNSISPFTTLEVWLPSSRVILPQIADQFSGGYYYANKKKGLSFNIDVFYKKMQNQIDYEDHADLLLNPLIEGEIRFGKANSYGVETIIMKQKGKLTGWLSYTYSRSFRQTNDINNNKTYPSLYDRPHDFSINFTYHITSRLEFSSVFNYATGSPVTIPTSFFEYRGKYVPVYSEKNNARFPDYHRLDIAISYQLNKRKRRFNHSLHFSLFNVYGRENPISYSFNKIKVDNEFLVPTNQHNTNEILATKRYVFKTVPSFSYNFKF